MCGGAVAAGQVRFGEAVVCVCVGRKCRGVGTTAIGGTFERDYRIRKKQTSNRADGQCRLVARSTACLL